MKIAADENSAKCETAEVITAAGNFLEVNFAGSSLPTERLSQFSVYKVIAGWRIETPTGNELDVLLTDEFPYAPPRFALADESKTLEWPHVDRFGYLCVLPAAASIDAANPLSVLSECIGEADILMKKCADGANVEDFREEFLSYWGLKADGTLIHSLLNPRGPSRAAHVYRAGTHSAYEYTIGESKEQITSWLKNQGRIKSNASINFKRAFLLWLERPLIPAEYPDSADDLVTLANEVGVGGSFKEYLIENPSTTSLVLLGAKTSSGAGFCAVLLSALRNKTVRKGFTGRDVPPKILLMHAGSKTRAITKCSVSRKDAHWVHSRDSNDKLDKLLTSRVGIIGCGALGSAVGNILIRAGVGSALLMDGESLTADNTSRHVLGDPYVGQNKAEALARFFELYFPHVREIEALPRNISIRDDAINKALSKCTLILSTTGEWASMCSLNDMHQSIQGWPPLITAWLEPHAIASITVMTRRGGPCISCGFAGNGKPLRNISQWDDPDAMWVKAPGCSAIFSPFGPVDVTMHAGMVANHCLQVLRGEETATARGFIGSPDRLTAAGGRWSDYWLNVCSGNEPGMRETTIDWPDRNDCPVCGRRN
jgi:sulfur-carrier protein adenylyltransferase/sulfurtransferase